MSDNGWILTSERLPVKKDCGPAEGFAVWAVVKSSGTIMRQRCDAVTSTCFIAWRPIDPPPAFIPPPVYRDVVMPDDWGRDVEFADHCNFLDWHYGVLSGYAKDCYMPYMDHEGEVYKFCRIKVSPTC